MLLHKFTDMMTSASVERATVLYLRLRPMALVWGKLTHLLLDAEPRLE